MNEHQYNVNYRHHVSVFAAVRLHISNHDTEWIFVAIRTVSQLRRNSLKQLKLSLCNVDILWAQIVAMKTQVHPIIISRWKEKEFTGSGVVVDNHVLVVFVNELCALVRCLMPSDILSPARLRWKFNCLDDRKGSSNKNNMYICCLWWLELIFVTLRLGHI